MNIIVINGPAGVGKTTIARKLCELNNDSICIHGDSIKEFVVNRNNPEIEKQLAYKIGASLIDRYIEAGYKFIVFEFVFETCSHIDLMKKLLAHLNVKYFILWDELENIILKEKKRINRLPLKNRVIECYTTLQRNILNMDIEVIDNSKDINYTIEQIIQKL